MATQTYRPFERAIEALLAGAIGAGMGWGVAYTFEQNRVVYTSGGAVVCAFGVWASGLRFLDVLLGVGEVLIEVFSWSAIWRWCRRRLFPD